MSLRLALVVCLALALLGGGGCLRRQPTTAPLATRVALNGLQPRFVGDGNSIVFTRYQRGREFMSEIVLAHLPSGNVTNLTRNSWPDEYPAPSRDGNQILFCSRKDARDNLWMLDRRGGQVYTATDLGGTQPDWSPLYPVALFVTVGATTKRDIFALDLSTGQRRTIVATPADEAYPRWAPDGRRFAYVTDESGTDQVHIYDIAARQSLSVTSLPGNQRFPCWSPDGKTIVFSSDYLPAPPRQDPNQSQTLSRPVNLWSVDVSDPAQPGFPQMLVQSGLENGQSLHPDFSPDGRKLAFATNGAGLDWEIVTLDYPRLLKAAEEARKKQGLGAPKLDRPKEE